MPHATFTMISSRPLLSALSVLGGLMVGMLVGACSQKLHASVELSTPEAAIATYHKALQAGDYALFKRTFFGPVEISEVQFRRDFVLPEGLLVDYTIVKKKQYGKDDSFARAGDVWILIEKRYKGNKHPPGLMNFILRSTERGWLITDWNVPETPSETGLGTNLRKPAP